MPQYSGLAKTFPRGTVNEKEVDGSITEWTGVDFASLNRTAENGAGKGVVAESSMVPQRPCEVIG